MKWAIIGLVLLGVLAAVSVAVLVASLPHLMGGGARRAEPGEPQEVSIVVAAEDLAVSSVVKGQSVAVLTVPASEAPSEYFSRPENVIGRVLACSVVKDQAFTSSLFATKGSSLQLAAALEDKRAIQLSLPDYAGLKGLLYPSSRVDIVAAFDPGREGEPIATTLLQDILVLKVEGRTIFSGPEPPQEKLDMLGPARRMLVVVQVTSEQAQTLLLAQEHGTIALVLRKPTDVTTSDVAPTRLSHLVHAAAPAAAMPAPLPQPAPVPAEPAQPEPAAEAPPEPGPSSWWETTVIRGANAEVVVFPVDCLDEIENEDLQPSGAGAGP